MTMPHVPGSQATPTPSPAAPDPLDEQDELQQALAAYALGSLEAPEHDDVESHLTDSPEARALLREYDEVLRLMPYGLPPAAPSPGTRSLLLARAQMRRELAERQRAVWWKTPSLRIAAVGLLAAVLVLVATTFIVVRFSDDDPASNDTTEQIIAELREDPDAKVVRLAGEANMPQAGANLIMTDDRSDAGLIAWNLPVQDYDRCYQLWFEDSEGAMVSGGTFWVDAAGDATSLVSMPTDMGEMMLVGVTDEPMGGSTTPTGPNVMSAALN